jgi:prolipoprotein diacylglyceryl transferase
LQVSGISVHLYGLFFAAGLLAGGLVVNCFMKKLDVSQNYFIYAFLGIFIGARLFHCVFYEMGYYLMHPLEIFLPFSFENGKIAFTGFNGLASHGGTVGLIAGLWFYCKNARKGKRAQGRKGKTAQGRKGETFNFFLQICDIFALAVPLAGAFIRVGNLMNSEIIGAPTTVKWAFIFPSVDFIPRHPAQIYEAIWYFILFFLMLALFLTIKSRVRNGFFVAFGFLGVAIFRFLIEFVKANQVDFEKYMFFNIGQWLSLPFILAGFAIIFIFLKKKVEKNLFLKN